MKNLSVQYLGQKLRERLSRFTKSSHTTTPVSSRKRTDPASQTEDVFFLLSHLDEDLSHQIATEQMIKVNGNYYYRKN